MQTFAKTDKGKVRSINQDAFYINILSDGSALAVVCDGMGGASAGDVASKTAVDIIAKYVSNAYIPTISSDQITRLISNAVASANMFGSPVIPQNFAKFDISAIITIMPIAIAAMMEHIGDIAAIGATTGENYIEDPGLHRTLLGDGIGSIAGAIFGGCPNTTYGESVGCVAITKNASVYTIMTAAILALLISFILLNLEYKI